MVLVVIHWMVFDSLQDRECDIATISKLVQQLLLVYFSVDTVFIDDSLLAWYY